MVSRFFFPVSLCVIVLLLLGIFRLKDETAATRARVQTLDQAVADERDAQAILRAETQYLARPSRADAPSLNAPSPPDAEPTP
jgi:hypothetical protein